MIDMTISSARYLLVGNFIYGTINAFNPTKARFWALWTEETANQSLSKRLQSETVPRGANQSVNSMCLSKTTTPFSLRTML
jgi:hypothetical protein